jgi:hypothetical protein
MRKGVRGSMCDERIVKVNCIVRGSPSGLCVGCRCGGCSDQKTMEMYEVSGQGDMLIVRVIYRLSRKASGASLNAARAIERTRPPVGVISSVASFAISTVQVAVQVQLQVRSAYAPKFVRVVVNMLV